MTAKVFERVAEIADVPEGLPHAATLEDGTGICLIKVGEEVFAVADRCSHAEFPMSDGDMIDDYVIECGLHGAQFDIRTGQVLELPATDPLPCFEVKLEGGAVWVRGGPCGGDGR